MAVEAGKRLLRKEREGVRLLSSGQFGSMRREELSINERLEVLKKYRSSLSPNSLAYKQATDQINKEIRRSYPAFFATMQKGENELYVASNLTTRVHSMASQGNDAAKRMVQYMRGNVRLAKAVGQFNEASKTAYSVWGTRERLQEFNGSARRARAAFLMSQAAETDVFSKTNLVETIAQNAGVSSRSVKNAFIGGSKRLSEMYERFGDDLTKSGLRKKYGTEWENVYKTVWGEQSLRRNVVDDSVQRAVFNRISPARGSAFTPEKYTIEGAMRESIRASKEYIAATELLNDPNITRKQRIELNKEIQYYRQDADYWENIHKVLSDPAFDPEEYQDLFDYGDNRRVNFQGEKISARRIDDLYDMYDAEIDDIQARGIDILGETPIDRYRVELEGRVFGMASDKNFQMTDLHKVRLEIEKTITRNPKESAFLRTMASAIDMEIIKAGGSTREIYALKQIAGKTSMYNVRQMMKFPMQEMLASANEIYGGSIIRSGMGARRVPAFARGGTLQVSGVEPIVEQSFGPRVEMVDGVQQVVFDKKPVPDVVGFKFKGAVIVSESQVSTDISKLIIDPEIARRRNLVLRKDMYESFRAVSGATLDTESIALDYIGGLLRQYMSGGEIPKHYTELERSFLGKLDILGTGLNERNIENLVSQYKGSVTTSFFDAVLRLYGEAYKETKDIPGVRNNTLINLYLGKQIEELSAGSSSSMMAGFLDDLGTEKLVTENRIEASIARTSRKLLRGMYGVDQDTRLAQYSFLWNPDKETTFMAIGSDEVIEDIKKLYKYKKEKAKLIDEFKKASPDAEDIPKMISDLIEKLDIQYNNRLSKYERVKYKDLLDTILELYRKSGKDTGFMEFIDNLKDYDAFSNPLVRHQDVVNDLIELYKKSGTDIPFDEFLKGLSEINPDLYEKFVMLYGKSFSEILDVTEYNKRVVSLEASYMDEDRERRYLSETLEDSSQSDMIQDVGSDAQRNADSKVNRALREIFGEDYRTIDLDEAKRHFDLIAREAITETTGIDSYLGAAFGRYAQEKSRYRKKLIERDVASTLSFEDMPGATVEVNMYDMANAERIIVSATMGSQKRIMNFAMIDGKFKLVADPRMLPSVEILGKDLLGAPTAPREEMAESASRHIKELIRRNSPEAMTGDSLTARADEVIRSAAEDWFGIKGGTGDEIIEAVSKLEGRSSLIFNYDQNIEDLMSFLAGERSLAKSKSFIRPLALLHIAVQSKLSQENSTYDIIQQSLIDGLKIKGTAQEEAEVLAAEAASTVRDSFKESNYGRFANKLLSGEELTPDDEIIALRNAFDETPKDLLSKGRQFLGEFLTDDGYRISRNVFAGSLMVLGVSALYSLGKRLSHHDQGTDPSYGADTRISMNGSGYDVGAQYDGYYNQAPPINSSSTGLSRLTTATLSDDLESITSNDIDKMLAGEI